MLFVLGKADYVVDGFLFTIFLAIAFTCLQVYEYLNAPFNLSDGIYGSLFIWLQGFMVFMF